MTLSDAFRRFPSALMRQALTALIATLNLPENPELALRAYPKTPQRL
jgi:hypothetical protein